MDEARAKKATVDAYPVSDLPEPNRQVFVVLFVNGEAVDGERVDTDGYSTEEIKPRLRYDAGRRWLADRTMAADARLAARHGPGTPGSTEQG